MNMTLRPFLLSVVLLVLAVNQPSFAKGAHGQHGSRAAAAKANANTKTANTKGANTKAANAKAATTRAEPTIAPPVLPSQDATRRANRTVNPNVKIVPPRNAAHGQAAGTATPAVRNAIGQPIIAAKNFVGSDARVSPGPQARGQGPGGVPPPRLHAAPAGTPPAASFRPTRTNAPAVSVANANRGSGSGTALTRPTATPTAIGGATRPNYGINGTTVQTRH